ncbi:Uncharacterized protein DBV15_08563 [Temnothorax longispinosus]|uniref:Uncharacterized protein n=1 Tax=Temnothorax longispinosus TaxID=300112 RepID=A0A4S2L4E1_9HYME|nr:Uncharacterized protein DBV15_08563 [Temnothorax longispinosus]
MAKSNPCVTQACQHHLQLASSTDLKFRWQTQSGMSSARDKIKNFNDKTNRQLLERNSRQPPGQLKQRLALVRLALQQLGTICCDDRHYLLTVYLFTQRNLLFRLPDFAALSRLAGQQSLEM